jgi:hypothetical protein
MRRRCAVWFEENTAVVCVLMLICDYIVFVFCRTKVIRGTQYCDVFCYDVTQRCSLVSGGGT